MINGSMAVRDVMVNKQLFQELKDRFPELPEAILTSHMKICSNNRDRCIEVLTIESPKYLYGNMPLSTSAPAQAHYADGMPSPASMSDLLNRQTSASGRTMNTSHLTTWMGTSTSSPNLHDIASHNDIPDLPPYPTGFDPRLFPGNRRLLPDINCINTSAAQMDDMPVSSDFSESSQSRYTSHHVYNVNTAQVNQPPNVLPMSLLAHGHTPGSQLTGPPQLTSPVNCPSPPHPNDVQQQQHTSTIFIPERTKTPVPPQVPPKLPPKQPLNVPSQIPVQHFSTLNNHDLSNLKSNQIPHPSVPMSGFPSAGSTFPYPQGARVEPNTTYGNYNSLLANQVHFSINPVNPVISPAAESQNAWTSPQQTVHAPQFFMPTPAGPLNSVIHGPPSSGPSHTEHSFPNRTTLHIPTYPAGNPNVGHFVGTTPVSGTVSASTHYVINKNDGSSEIITQSPFIGVGMSPASSMSSVSSESPQRDVPPPGRRGSEDVAYISALTSHQTLRKQKLKEDYSDQANTLEKMRDQVQHQERGLLERQNSRSSSFPTVEDVASLRESNRKLQTDIMCFTREIDMYNNGQTPLGILDPLEQENFFQHMNTGPSGSLWSDEHPVSSSSNVTPTSQPVAVRPVTMPKPTPYPRQPNQMRRPVTSPSSLANPATSPYSPNSHPAVSYTGQSSPNPHQTASHTPSPQPLPYTGASPLSGHGTTPPQYPTRPLTPLAQQSPYPSAGVNPHQPPLPYTGATGLPQPDLPPYPVQQNSATTPVTTNPAGLRPALPPRRPPPPIPPHVMPRMNQIPPAPAHQQPHSSSGDSEDGEQWSCGACTFLNHPALNKCECCDMPRVTIGAR